MDSYKSLSLNVLRNLGGKYLANIYFFFFLKKKEKPEQWVKPVQFNQ